MSLALLLWWHVWLDPQQRACALYEETLLYCASHPCAPETLESLKRRCQQP